MASIQHWLHSNYRDRVRFALEVDEDMSGEAYIIDIDSIVLTGADLRHPDRLNALIEAEVRRALGGADLRMSTGIANSETRVAAEVARTVVRSVRGEAEGV